MGNIHSNIELRRNWVARLFLPGPLVYVASAGLLVRPSKAAPGFLLSYDDIVTVVAQRGWLWDTIIVTQGNNSDPVVMRGVRHCQAPIIEAPARAAKTSKALPLQGMLERIIKHESFVSSFDDEQLKLSHDKALADVNTLAAGIRAGTVADDAWRAGLPALAFEEAFEGYSRCSREEWNKKFVPAEILRIGPWVRERFHPELTEEQLRAVVNDEDNQLVVAGAGTGKTSTVLGKIAYLVECRKVAPERILVLAFNKDVAAEVRRRVEELGIPASGEPGGQSVLASTYHALGGNIVRAVGNAVPKKVSRLEKDKVAREQFIQAQLLALLRSEKTHADVRDFLAFYSTPLGDARDYPSYEAYVQSDSAANLRTLRDGEVVKSHGERLTANWLFLHGIAYQYEEPFSFPKGNPLRQRYQPDFALAGGGIYIEYYGIDANGQTAPGIDRAGYLKSRDWKRALHKQHETACIELTYAQLKSGAFFAALSDAVEAALGTPVKFISIKEIEKRFIKGEGQELSPEMESTVELLHRFLTLFRSNLWTLAELEGRMTGPREACFFRIFKAILPAYMSELDSVRETDFAGMIADAAPLIPKWSGRFDHIIVDEFQDISRGREIFLRGLLELTPGRRLCAVGDDWQSVYRFTGSDVSVMTGFEYGEVARSDLKQSFRFTDTLQKVSSRFIQKNPAQLKKELVTIRATTKQSIFLLEYDGKPASPEYTQAHKEAVDDYLKRFSPKKREVMLLSRYNRGVAAIKELLPHLDATVSYSNLTVHRSKGLEADCVIVSHVGGGRTGFPCAREDDPLIRCVLTDPDDFPHAEERRLFYVALTRAKTAVYLLAPAGSRSLFITELLEDFAASKSDERLMVHMPGAGGLLHRCPVCQGTVVQRAADGSVFWSCDNSPACFFTTEKCPTCQKAPLLPPKGSNGFLWCAACGDSKTHVCPKCRQGGVTKRLRRVDSKPFWACSFFAKTGCSYSSNQAPS